MPRRHIEEFDGVPYKLGMFIDKAHRRDDKLSTDRRPELDEFGMRW